MGNKTIFTRIEKEFRNVPKHASIYGIFYIILIFFKRIKAIQIRIFVYKIQSLKEKIY
jgi:hypothetical protein